MVIKTFTVPMYSKIFNNFWHVAHSNLHVTIFTFGTFPNLRSRNTDCNTYYQKLSNILDDFRTIYIYFPTDDKNKMPIKRLSTIIIILYNFCIQFIKKCLNFYSIILNLCLCHLPRLIKRFSNS